MTVDNAINRLRFNPLPSPEQGEICPDLYEAYRDLVFQSAPLTGARGDGTRFDPFGAG